MRFLGDAPPLMRLTFHVSVLVFLLSPPLTVGRPLLALWLGSAKIDQHADRLSRHRWYLLRQSMTMLKTVGGLAWGADPEVRRALGWPAYGEDPGTRRSA